jgi:hypothetical protein
MTPEDPDRARSSSISAKPFEKLRDEMKPERRKRVDRRVHDALLKMTLQELRQHASGKPKAELEELLDLIRGAISQLEGRSDVLLNKLAECTRNLGGDLELVARFPDADVRITQFDDNDEETAASGT